MGNCRWLLLRITGKNNHSWGLRWDVDKNEGKDTEITAFEQLKENSEPISENSRILSILESIREDTAFIKQALDSVPTVSDDQATALATIINARERSNVAMIELLQDMVAERFQ